MKAPQNNPEGKKNDAIIISDFPSLRNAKLQFWQTILNSLFLVAFCLLGLLVFIAILEAWRHYGS